MIKMHRHKVPITAVPDCPVCAFLLGEDKSPFSLCNILSTHTARTRSPFTLHAQPVQLLFTRIQSAFCWICVWDGCSTEPCCCVCFHAGIKMSPLPKPLLGRRMRVE